MAGLYFEDQNTMLFYWETVERSQEVREYLQEIIDVLTFYDDIANLFPGIEAIKQLDHFLPHHEEPFRIKTLKRLATLSSLAQPLLKCLNATRDKDTDYVLRYNALTEREQQGVAVMAMDCHHLVHVANTQY